MISISKKRWNEIPELSDNDLSSELLQTISLIYENLDEKKRYAYLMEIDFGDFIINYGTINIKEIKSTEKSIFEKDTKYSRDPLALVINNQIEVFAINRCRNRKRIIKKKRSDDSDSIIGEEEYIVPLNTIKKGDFYGVFGTLDHLSGIKTSNEHGMDWFAISGLSSFLFDFPFFYSTVKIKEEYTCHFSQNKDRNKNYYPGKEQIDFFKMLLPNYKTKVIYFPEYIFKSSDTNLREKLHHLLLIKGWLQYSPLRNNIFENKVLSDTIRYLSLNNPTEFMLKLYDYLRNVFLGNGKILRPLKYNEKHFLNEAINKFYEDCKNYFADEKKHILPLCFVYDESENVDIGILSMTNIPILKNYKYTNLNDIMHDLKVINDEFTRIGLANYTFDLKMIKGYGGIDNTGKTEMEINGTVEFKELISKLFNINSSKILPASGQFKNAIAITLKKS